MITKNAILPLSTIAVALLTITAISSCKHIQKQEYHCNQQDSLIGHSFTKAEVNTQEQESNCNQQDFVNDYNCPLITNNYIQYKNLTGEEQTVGIIDEATISLYSAIQKYTSRKEPNIVDITSFYTDVEKNISKNEIGNSNYNIRRTNDIEDINKNLKISIATTRHLQCSNLFNKLYDMFTAPNSEKGDTITVNEYTKMMDAWSSTGKKVASSL